MISITIRADWTLVQPAFNVSLQETCVPKNVRSSGHDRPGFGTGNRSSDLIDLSWARPRRRKLAANQAVFPDGTGRCRTGAGRCERVLAGADSGWPRRGWRLAMTTPPRVFSTAANEFRPVRIAVIRRLADHGHRTGSHARQHS